MLGPQLHLDASQNGAIDRERMSTEAAATEAQPRPEEPRSPPGDTLASQDDQNNIGSRRASASSSRAQSNMSSSTDFKLPPRVKTAPKTEGKKKEIYRVFDAVPFTPSQGVRTPSPNNMAALRWRHISPFANPHYMRTDSPKSVLRRPPTSDTSSGSESSAAHPHSPAHPAQGMPAYSPFMMYPMGPPIPGYMAAEMHPGSPHHPHSPLIPGSPVATPPGAMFHSSPFAPLMPGSPVVAGGPYHSPFGMGMHMGGMPMQPPPPPPPAQHGSNTPPHGNNTQGAAGGMQRAHTSPPPPPPPMGQQQQQQQQAGGAAGPSQLASPVNMPSPASAMPVHQQPGAGPRMVSPFYPTSMGYSSGYPQGVPFMQPPMAYPHMPSPLGLDASGAALRRQLSTPLPVPGQVPMMASPLPAHMAAAVSPQRHSAIRLSQSAEFGELAGLKLLHHQQAQQQLLQRGTRFAGKSRKNAEPKIGPDGNPRLNARQRRTLRRAKERALKGLLEVSQVLLQRADIPIPTITAALERDLAMASDCDSDDDDGDCASPTALSRAGSMSLSPPGMGRMGQESPGAGLSRTHSTSLTCAEPLQECSKPCSPLPQMPAARDSASPSQQQQQQDVGLVGSSDEPASGDSPEMSENGAGDDDADADADVDGEAHGGSALASFDMAGLIAQLTLSKEEGLIDDKLIRDLQIIQSLIGALKTPGSAGSQQQSLPQQQPAPAAAATPTPPVQQQQQQQQQPSMSPAALHLQQQQQQALLKAQLQHQQHQHMQQQLQQQQLQQMQHMQQMQLAAGLTTSPVPNLPLPGMYGALSPAGMMGPVHPAMHGMHAGLPGMMPGAGMPVNAMRRPDPRVRRTFSFAAGC